MALQSTADYSAEFTESKKELPGSPEGHIGYHCLIGHVEGRTIRGKDGKPDRRIIEVYYVAAKADPTTGVTAGAVHTETYWIDDKEGRPASVPRMILSNAIRSAADGDYPIDFGIAETIGAHMLGRYVRVVMTETQNFGPQTKAVLPPKDRTKAQAALREYDADLCDRLDARRVTLQGMLATYQKTGQWPQGGVSEAPMPPAGPKHADNFTDDAIPF